MKSGFVEKVFLKLKCNILVKDFSFMVFVL